MDDGQPIEDVARTGHKTPPYVSFRTFLTLVEDLKTDGLPPRIDRSVLKRFSGAVGSQLLVCLRSLGLMDTQNQPSLDLERLTQTYGDEAEFKRELRRIIDRSYPFLTDIDLMTATPSMFAEAFKSGTDAKEAVLRKCRTFYLHAADHVGIELGPRLKSGGFPRAPSGGGAGTKRRSKKRTPDPVPPAEERSVIRQQEAFPYEMFLGKFPPFDPTWPDEIKAKWFEGFERLMDSAQIAKRPQ